MNTMFRGLCTSDLLIVLSYIVTNIRVACWFSVPAMSQCASLDLISSFMAKKVYLNLCDITARLSVLCAFMLDVEICFQCFDCVVWSSRSTSAHSLNVCLYISDRQRVFGCYTRCAINTALC